MDACGCGAGPQSAITFDGGVEMLRCKLCGTTSWTLDGRPVSHDAAHTALRGTFIATRRQSAVPRAPRARQVVDLREPAVTPQPATGPAVVQLSEVDLGGALADLLKTKGIGGSWTVSR